MTVYNINTKDENGDWDPKKHWTKTLKDNGGWAERVASYWDPDLEEWVLFDRLETAVVDIRTKVGLGDIAIAPRRYNNPPQGRPDSLYQIHVDNGIVKTSIREFPDVDELGWVDQFELGNGTGVAVCFDGNWIAYENVWRLITEEKPWIFWVNDLNELHAQKWNDDTTLIQLATGVDTISTIRGWKNFSFKLADDQGLIVAYVKTDGTAWYRNYCLQDDDSVVWEIERQITDFTGPAKNISLALGIDYKLIVTIENTLGDIYWLVTKRQLVGMGIGQETFSNPPSVTDFSMTQWIKEIFINESVETFSNPPSVIAFDIGMRMCTVEDLADTIEPINVTYTWGSEIVTYEFPMNIEFIVSKEDFIANGIDSVFTIGEVTLVDNLLTVTFLQELPVTGFTVVLNADQFKAVMSQYCTRYDSLGYVIEDGGFPAQEQGTFSNPPSVTGFTINQNIHSVIIHTGQPTETFSNPPSVTSFTITILDVNGDPI